MKSLMRGVAALMLSATLLPVAASPQAATPAAQPAFATERERVSYMVGMDVGASLRRFSSSMDMAAFEKSFRNTLVGGEPLLDEATMRSTTQALMALARPGGMPPGSQAPTVDPTRAGLAAGIGVGASLLPISDEIDPDIVMQALRTVAAGGAPRLDQAQYEQVRSAFQQKVQARAQAEAAALGARNASEGAAFLAANKPRPGVVTTGSGLHHKICHVLGGRYDLSHAATHAVVLPHVLALNAPHAPEAERRLAAALGASSAVAGLADLYERLDAPRSLRDLGLREDQVADAAAAILPAVPPSNPATVSRAVLEDLLRAAWGA